MLKLIKSIIKYFKETKKEEVFIRTHIDGEILSKQEEEIFQTTTKCPDCGGNLLEGPSGGISINFKCPNCNAKFNWYGGIFPTKRISDSFIFPPKKGEQSEDGYIRFNSTGNNYEKIKN